MAVYSKIKSSLTLAFDNICKYYIEILICAFFVICYYSVNAYIETFKEYGISKDTDNWGTFGDYIGGILGTILSFFSIILIYATYKNQVRTSILQQFETTFFNLINNQRKIISSMKGMFETHQFFDEYSESTGDEYISKVAQLINRRFDAKNYRLIDENGVEVASDSDNLIELKEIIRKAYNDIYEGREAELGHYFRHLYHIFKYTDESDIKNKRKYIDILQAQFSDDELYIILYNGMSEYGSKKFHPLLEKYQFFENIRSRGRLFDKQTKAFYPQTEFKYKTQ